MTTDKSVDTQLHQILTKYQDGSHNNMESILTSLMELHEVATDEEEALEVRRAFLFVLKDKPVLLEQEQYSTFLAEHVEPEDFLALEWDALDGMMLFCESLYSFRFRSEDMANRVQIHVQNLLRHVLQKFEESGEHEKMFQLLQLSPMHPMMQDAELRRLRHQAYAYEMHRVRRNRRILYMYLIIQSLFVLVVFPVLFINAENGRLQREVEQLTDVDIGDDGYERIEYSEAVYWSIITASSIGYGDITPTTSTGRIIAAILGTMGVITVGIFAGLILDWLSPRRIS